MDKRIITILMNAIQSTALKIHTFIVSLQNSKLLCIQITFLLERPLHANTVPSIIQFNDIIYLLHTLCRVWSNMASYSQLYSVGMHWIVVCN